MKTNRKTAVVPWNRNAYLCSTVGTPAGNGPTRNIRTKGRPFISSCRNDRLLQTNKTSSIERGNSNQKGRGRRMHVVSLSTNHRLPSLYCTPSNRSSPAGSRWVCVYVHSSEKSDRTNYIRDRTNLSEAGFTVVHRRCPR